MRCYRQGRTNWRSLKRLGGDGPLEVIRRRRSAGDPGLFKDSVRGRFGGLTDLWVNFKLFQVALNVPRASAQSLEEGIAALQMAQPPLRRVELRTSCDAESLLVLLGFDDSRSFTLQHQRVGALANVLSAQLIDLEHLDARRRERFETQREASTLSAAAEGDLAPIFVALRRQAPAAGLRVAFDSEEALLTAWAHQVAEGALWVPTARTGDAEVFSVVLVTPEREYPGCFGTRVRRAPMPGKVGLWIELNPSKEFTSLLAGVAQQRREPRMQRVTPRPIERLESDLDVHIETIAALAAQYAADLTHGGLFVATDEPPALSSRVRLHLRLPNDEVLTLRAEVVHRVMSGPRVGVGVQFVELSPDTFAPIEALLAKMHRRPRVLVVDDEAIWRSTLVRVLQALEVDIVLAKDGREGMVKLIDGYFDLDLVVVDLHMPNLDGRGLIDRVRRLGGDAVFKIFLFSAASPEELQPMREKGQASAVFSKLEPLDLLASQLASELGRSWPPRPAAKS